MSMKGEWLALRARVDGYLEDNADVLEPFREMAGKVFADLALHLNPAGEPLLRKPNISLRLIALGEPRAKLITLPRWTKYGNRPGTLDTAAARSELLVERDVDTERGTGKNWARRFTAVVRELSGQDVLPNHPWRSHYFYRSSAESDARRLVAVARAFVDNPGAALARSHDNCSICGRRLRDELSRARGIGPECIKVAPYLVALTERSLIQAE